MSRENIHSKIYELLELLSIHNGRLSLHAEKLSQLDIDVLRKQCIDLYDQVNLLALKGKIVAKSSVQNTTHLESSLTPKSSDHIAAEVVASKNEITETAKEEDLNVQSEEIIAPPVEKILNSEVVAPESKLPIKKEKMEADML